MSIEMESLAKALVNAKGASMPKAFQNALAEAASFICVFNFKNY